MRSVAIGLALVASGLCAACSGPSADIVITLERTICLGECPDYRVEIRGDGRVTYHGENYVAVEGDYSWTIPQDDEIGRASCRERV